MPEIVLDFTPELKERVDFWSSRNNKTPDAFLKNIIAEYLEDLEDYEEAARVHAEVQAGRMQTHSWEELMERFNFDDGKGSI